MPKYEYGWFAAYNQLDGWLIKVDNARNTPVCQIPEPLGGEKNEYGRNAYAEECALLIAAAPALLAACRVALEYITPEESAYDVLQRAIKMATEL